MKHLATRAPVANKSPLANTAARIDRGAELAAKGAVTQVADGWVIMGSKGDVYLVGLDGACSCAHLRFRGTSCRHYHAALQTAAVAS